MNAVVFEHVPVSELPQAWRDKLDQTAGAHVTVRIEAEVRPAATPLTEAFVTDDPAFGIWRDREDMADVAAQVRRLRAPRFKRDGSRSEQR